jgi:CHAD domain-containing protein/CYTH domain-containing protein
MTRRKHLDSQEYSWASKLTSQQPLLSAALRRQLRQHFGRIGGVRAGGRPPVPKITHSARGRASMRLPAELPNLLVDEGSRRLALVHLEEAAAARSRVASSSDTEALHDYRVALRRLRSCLRAYDKHLRSSVSRKKLRQLRRLARGTNRSRDLEVHLAWLGEQRDRFGEAEQPGASWILGRLTAAQRRAWDDLLRLDRKLFPKVHDRLVVRLSAFRATIRLDADPSRRSTAAVAASRVRAASRRLKSRLLAIRGYSSAAEIHRARIAAKRLRYLLEPFAGGIPGGDVVIDRLKTLQDDLGDVHDAHVFVAELRESLPEAESTASSGPDVLPGLRALMASLRLRGFQAFAKTSPAWLGDRAEPFFGEIDVIADAIAGLAGQGQEIERKFLLTGLPSLDKAGGPIEIEQGYLPGERVIERLRRIRSGGRVELVRTVKEGSGLTRLEVEEAVMPDVFERLWPLTDGRRLRKRRYRIAEGTLTWEIDEFLDRDLVLAEVELPGQQTEIRIPEWLQPHLDREVTEDTAYSNVHLAASSSSVSQGVPVTSNPGVYPGGEPPKRRPPASPARSRTGRR